MRKHFLDENLNKHLGKQKNSYDSGHEQKRNKPVTSYSEVQSLLQQFEEIDHRCEHEKTLELCNFREQLRKEVGDMVEMNKNNQMFKDLVSKYNNLTAARGGTRGKKTRRKIKKRRGRKPKSAKKMV